MFCIISVDMSAKIRYAFPVEKFIFVDDHSIVVRFVSVDLASAQVFEAKRWPDKREFTPP